MEKELSLMYGDNYTNYPIKSSINVCKKVVNSKSTIYREPPKRDYSDMSDEQVEVVEKVYDDMGVDHKLMTSTRLYELQGQNHIYCGPKEGKLQIRPLKNHNLNVVPKDDNPEVGEIYIMSAFDKILSSKRTHENDGVNQQIGDLDDYDRSVYRHIVWSPSFHFVMDGNGNIISGDDVENPISPLVPFIEVSAEKDFEYWTRRGSSSVNFTTEYNTSLSEQAHIVKMQGFAQAYLKAPEELMPESVTIGPAYLIKLVTNPDLQGDVEFGFANPGSDLNGVQEYGVSLLSQYLSTEGLDANAISATNTSAQKFASGTERLLALIEKFEASKDTISLYEEVEKKLFVLIAAWLNVLKDTDQILPEYKTTEIKNGSLSIVYNRPEGSVTDLEKVELIERKVDLGVMTKKDIIMELENKTSDEADDRLKELEAEETMDVTFNGSENREQDNQEE